MTGEDEKRLFMAMARGKVRRRTSCPAWTVRQSPAGTEGSHLTILSEKSSAYPWRATPCSHKRSLETAWMSVPIVLKWFEPVSARHRRGSDCDARSVDRTLNTATTTLFDPPASPRMDEPVPRGVRRGPEPIAVKLDPKWCVHPVQ